MTNQELAALVAKAQAGNKRALNDLITNCYQDLFFYAMKAVQDRDLAADITQDSCIDIISKISELREPGAFQSWARRIVHTRCTRYFRQTHEVTVDEDENGETIFDRLPDESDGVLPEQVQEDKEFRQTMQQMLDALPPEQRTSLLLYYYEKLSVSQIADIQGVSDGTVKSRLNYGRKAVKAKVVEYEKKTGVRLHSIAPLPLLLYFLLAKEKEQVLSKCAPVSGGVLSAAGTVAGTGTAVGAGIGVKIAASIAALALVVGVTVGGIAVAQNSKRAEPEPTRTTMDASVLRHLPEIWYGTEYSDGGAEDVMLLQDDGTVLIKGTSYQITSVERLNGTVELQHPHGTQLWEQGAPGYRLFISSQSASVQLDLLTVPGYHDPVVAFFYQQYQIGEEVKLAVSHTFSITPPESQPDLPLELLADLVGTWEYLPIDNYVCDESFVLNKDGTVLYRGQTYVPENIRIDEATESSNECIVYELSSTSEEGYTWLGIDFVTLPDGTHAAEMSGMIPGQGSTELNHFYRPEEFSGYQKVLLTSENWQDYVTLGYSWPNWVDEETGKFHAGVEISLHLKEGVAPISYFCGDIHYTGSRQKYLAKPGGVLDLAGTDTQLITEELGTLAVFDAKQQLRLWCANPESPENVAHRHEHSIAYAQMAVGSPEEGVTVLLPVFQQLWAENVVGCVYIPIN